LTVIDMLRNDDEKEVESTFLFASELLLESFREATIEFDSA